MGQNQRSTGRSIRVVSITILMVLGLLGRLGIAEHAITSEPPSESRRPVSYVKQPTQTSPARGDGTIQQFIDSLKIQPIDLLTNPKEVEKHLALYGNSPQQNQTIIDELLAESLEQIGEENPEEFAEYAKKVLTDKAGLDASPATAKALTKIMDGLKSKYGQNLSSQIDATQGLLNINQLASDKTSDATKQKIGADIFGTMTKEKGNEYLAKIKSDKTVPSNVKSALNLAWWAKINAEYPAQTQGELLANNALDQPFTSAQKKVAMFAANANVQARVAFWAEAKEAGKDPAKQQEFEKKYPHLTPWILENGGSHKEVRDLFGSVATREVETGADGKLKFSETRVIKLGAQDALATLDLKVTNTRPVSIYVPRDGDVGKIFTSLVDSGSNYRTAAAEMATIQQAKLIEPIKDAFSFSAQLVSLPVRSVLENVQKKINNAATVAPPKTLSDIKVGLNFGSNVGMISSVTEVKDDLSGSLVLVKVVAKDGRKFEVKMGRGGKLETTQTIP